VRALQLTDQGVELKVNVPLPEQGPGRAVVRPLLSAIGLSDTRVVQRGRFRGVLGHEFVGVIESIDGEGPGGSGHGLRAGARVTAWHTEPCGTCDLCKGGLSAHCRDLRTLGQRGLDGCLAERVVVSTDRLLAIPTGLSDEQAVFTQAVGAALHAARLVTLESQAFVTVLGDGPLALLAAQVMARRNATVRLLTDRERPLELCAKWGLRHRPTHQTGLRADQDVVVECSGSADASAFGMIRPRGSVLMVVPPAEPIDLSKAWSAEIQLLNARGCAMVEALRELSSGALQTAGLVERVMPFDQAADALALAARPGSLKVLVRH
jgi:alcohol dehydrogenase